MKPIYRCDYCDYMGTENEVMAHEKTCVKNFNNKGCLTCVFCKTDGMHGCECSKGQSIPEGKQLLYCDAYENGEPEVVGFLGMILNMNKTK